MSLKAGDRQLHPPLSGMSNRYLVSTAHCALASWALTGEISPRVSRRRPRFDPRFTQIGSNWEPESTSWIINSLWITNWWSQSSSGDCVIKSLKFVNKHSRGQGGQGLKEHKNESLISQLLEKGGKPGRELVNIYRQGAPGVAEWRDENSVRIWTRQRTHRQVSPTHWRGVTR